MQPMHLILSKYQQISVFIIGLAISALTYAAPPSFSMAFSPTTIGPGSNSTLTFTIDNTAEMTTVSGLSFTNTLPAGVTIAAPSTPRTNCFNGTFSADAGSDSISISNYRLGLGKSCTLTVEVTSATIGTHVNTINALTSSAGSAGTATASLTVDSGRSGVSMSFSPSTINENDISTLTYTIDNSANAGNQDQLRLTNTLPQGVVISDQPNASTTCTGGIIPATITAEAGSNSINMQYAFVAAGSTCSASIDVVALESGDYLNKSIDLTLNFSNPSGGAAALLTAVRPFLNARFPTLVIPGESVVLKYTLNNSSRDTPATDISFSNDLNATLSGLSAAILPADGFCGVGSTMSGSSTLTVAGANLAENDSCTFEVTVLIPAGAAIGNYINSTSIVNLTLDSATTKPAISHSLIIKYAPRFQMSFIDDPVNAGDDVTLRFTVTNVDPVSQLANLTFTQRFSVSYAGMTLKTLPAASSCGVGSSFSNTNINTDDNAFQFTGGTIAPAESCMFDVTYTLPPNGSAGDFPHTTSSITGSLNGDNITGNAAFDVLSVRSAPSLSIDLLSEAVAPGGTVAAEFTLKYSDDSTADASNISFTVDLNSALADLEMVSAPMNDICGAGSSVSGTTILTFSEGSLAASEQCSFIITLQIPAGIDPQTYTVTSSEVTSIVAAMNTKSGAASDTQTVTGLVLTKTYLSNNLFPGDTSTIRYTIDNAGSSVAATDITFTDNLNNSLPGLSATSLPPSPCGAGSIITGTTFIIVNGGQLDAGSSCTFDVPISIPAGASQGEYNSPTSAMNATVNGNNTASPASTDTLYVDILEAVITTNASNPTYSSPIPVNIHFARPVIGFAESDLVITNGTSANFSGSGQDYSINISPTTTGNVVVTLPASSVTDAINPSIQNIEANLNITFLDPPANVQVTSPSIATTYTGSQFVIEGTHAIDASRVFLYADINNDGIADNATVLASDLVTNNVWSMTTALSPQVNNNFLVVWEDRVNNLNRSVNVPTITETTPNYTPVINGSPATTVDEDTNYSFTPTMTDANTNDTHTYSISNKPSWASFSTTTGVLSGMPLNANVGTNSNIIVTVTDSTGLSASLPAFAITVLNTNDALVISGAPSTSIAEDSIYSFTPSISDVDVGDSAIFNITNQPNWADFSSISGQLSGIPSNDDVGISNIISITVTDGGGASASLPEFVITVTNTNDAPEISGIPFTRAIEGLTYSFTPTLIDVDALDLLTTSIANKPSWAVFNQSTGLLTGNPTRSDIKTYNNIVISVSDGEITTNLVPFSITVLSDLDGDQISDDLDPDIDGDGMSNDFEIANGFDPFDAYDADGDLDGDGISNLDEFINNSNPTIDDYGPNIQFESPVTIDATAFLTKLPANLASADDAVDGLVLVGHNLTSELLRPGRHVITWSATDTLGNSTSKTQILNIQPLANWELNQEAGEGSVVSVTLHLNGEAPSYPVEAEYTVTGSAIAPDDHNAVSATLLINSGQSASINISIASDVTNELDETVTFSLESLRHAAIGKNKSHTITINEENHAPKVRLSTTTTLLNITSSVVTVNAAINDVDVGDSHTINWVSTNGLVGSASNTSFSFDPAITGTGTYQISATALDDAENPMQGSAVITVTILDQALDLSDSLDSDGDGIVDSIDGTGDSDGDGVPDFADGESIKNILAIYPIGGDSKDGFWIIETLPGLGLNLNEYSSASGNYTPLLTEGDLVDATNNKQLDFGHDYSCGIFDFIVSDLPVQGETVLVVLPQLCAIPINAIYRKEINGRWSEFEENIKNTLSSAPGELGVCPPPGSEEYISGLNKGHYCVQLGIEDGGQNDGDGAKNGSIMDPGGVAVAKPTKVSTSSSGGALGWASVLLMSFMALSRGLGATIIMLILSTSAQAEDWLKSIYATAHAGNADSNTSINEVQADFDNAGITNTTIDNVNSQRIGFGFGAGYTISPRWRTELSYLDLKQIDVDLTSTTAINNLEDIIPESGNGITLSVLHRFPLDEYMHLRMRLGAFKWQAEYEAPAGPGSQVVNGVYSGVDWYAGFGLDHQLSSQLYITTEFQYFDFERDSTTYLRIGLEWHLNYGK